jgi:glycosyltransferase involved in cell wall biosynthesis
MLFKLLRRLDSNVFIPTVISLTSYGVYGSKIKSLGVSVSALNMSFFNFPVCFIRLAYLIYKSKPCIVHTWMYHADLLGGICAHLLRVPKICWCIRNSGLSTKGNKLSTRIVVYFCSILSHVIPNIIISCSNKAVSNHISFGYSPVKFLTISNGFDVNKFFPNKYYRPKLCRLLNISNSSKLIGLIARYDPQKNHHGFLEAASIVSRQSPSANFILVGNNIDYNNKELLSHIEKYDLKNVVHLLGQISDVSYIISSLDILVSSSSWGEGFPNVVGEAMSSGVPCVVTDVGDSSFIVGKTGLVVPINDPNALSQNILYLLNKSAKDYLKLSRNARGRVMHYFNITDVTKKYENVYININ